MKHTLKQSIDLTSRFSFRFYFLTNTNVASWFLKEWYKNLTSKVYEGTKRSYLKQQRRTRNLVVQSFLSHSFLFSFFFLSFYLSFFVFKLILFCIERSSENSFFSPIHFEEDTRKGNICVTDWIKERNKFSTTNASFVAVIIVFIFVISSWFRSF